MESGCLKQRFPTGFRALDNVLQGGLLEHSLVNVIGPPGSGKTTFVRQAVYSGLMNGDRCIYLSTREPPSQIKRQMKLFNWDTDSFEKELVFIDAFSWNLPQERREKAKYQLDCITDLTGICEIFKKELKGGKRTRIVIDSLSDLFIYSDENCIFKLIKSLSAVIFTNSSIGLITLEYGAHPPKTVSTIDFLCTGTIELLNSTSTGKRILRINRMEDVKHPFGFVEFEIKETGLAKVAEAFGIW